MKQFLVIASFVLFPALAFGAPLRLLCFHSDEKGVLIKTSVVKQIVADLHPSGEAYIFTYFKNGENGFNKLKLVGHTEPHRMYAFEDKIYFNTYKEPENTFSYVAIFKLVVNGNNEEIILRCVDIDQEAAKGRGKK